MRIKYDIRITKEALIKAFSNPDSFDKFFQKIIDVMEYNERMLIANKIEEWGKKDL